MKNTKTRAVHRETLVDRVALVTGAGSGIGRATARLLAEAGAKVGLLGRTRGELEEVAQRIRSSGGEGRVLVADVSDGDQMTAALDEVRSAWDRLDIVVANAGINGVWAPLEQLTPAEWDKTLEVNLRGTFLTVRQSLPLLRRRGGAVVIVSSVNGTRMFSNTGASAYACSKAAQVAFSRMTALELAPQGIRVNTVCPGAIDTSIEENTEARDLEDVRLPVDFPEGSIPLTGGKAGSARQVAQVIWFLVSDAADHVTGTEVFVDGGQSLIEG